MKSILLLLLIWLALIVCYVGAITVLIAPGNTIRTDAFIISRPEYIETRNGRVVPVIIESNDVVTYTLVLSK